MKNLHSSINAVANIFFSLLLFVSLGTSAIVTQQSLPVTRVVDVAPGFITPAPEVDYQAIFARGNVATCGYVSGKAASPLTCPPSYMCTSTTVGYYPGWGCCDQIQCQGNYNECQDYGGNICQDADESICSILYSSILKCSSAAPSCVTYARSRSVGDLSTQISLGCGKTGGTILALDSTVNGQGNNAEATSAPGGNSAPISSTDVAQSVDVTGFSPTSDATQNTDDPSNTGGANPSKNNNNNNSSKLSVGEIAGIVIPIVAIIMAVVIGWWKRHQVVWCCTCGRHGHRHSQRPTRIDGGEPSSYGNSLRPIPPSQYGDYRPVNNVPSPFTSNQSLPVYNQFQPSPHPQASNPSISIQQTVPNGRQAPQPTWKVYAGN
ncbi:hypothetical protein MMC29_003990 [Sticta canariensis]|nr:hypothetical protein [Sticta canariensis]